MAESNNLENEEITLEDIEEYRRTGKFNKPSMRRVKTTLDAGILNKHSNEEILMAIYY